MLPYIYNKLDNGFSYILTDKPSLSEPEYWNVWYATGNSKPAAPSNAVEQYADGAVAFIRPPQRYKCTEKVANPVYQNVTKKIQITTPEDCLYLYSSYSISSDNTSISMTGRSNYSIPIAYTMSLDNIHTGSTYGIVAYGTSFSTTVYISKITYSTVTKNNLYLFKITLSNGDVYYQHPPVSASVRIVSGVAYRKEIERTLIKTNYYVKITGTTHYVKLKEDGKNYETPFVYKSNSSGSYSQEDLINACVMSPITGTSIMYSRNKAYLPVAEIKNKDNTIYPYLFNSSASARRSSHRLCLMPTSNSYSSIVTISNHVGWTSYYGVKITCDFYMGTLVGSYDRALFGFGADLSSYTSTTQLQHVRAYLSKNGDIRLYVNDKLTYPGYPFRDNPNKICRLVVDIKPTQKAVSSLMIFSDYEKEQYSYASSWNNVQSSNGILSSAMADMGTIAIFGVAKKNAAVSTWTMPGYSSNSSGITTAKSTGILKLSFDYYDRNGNVVVSSNFYAATFTSDIGLRKGFIDERRKGRLNIPLGHIYMDEFDPSSTLLQSYSIP